MLKRAVDVVQIAALAAAALAVGLLFYRPAAPKAALPNQAASLGASVYASNCAGCHGSRGEGSFGPKLAGGAVVRTFPDLADEIALVSDGRGGMPAWKTRLSPAEIQAVVDYTRTRL